MLGQPRPQQDDENPTVRRPPSSHHVTTEHRTEAEFISQLPLPSADSARLIVVAFPSTSARRSSVYVCQMIAYCCGDFPPLAEDPPAFVFGGDLSKDLALRRPGQSPPFRRVSV